MTTWQIYEQLVEVGGQIVVYFKNNLFVYLLKWLYRYLSLDFTLGTYYL